MQTGEKAKRLKGLKAKWLKDNFKQHQTISTSILRQAQQAKLNDQNLETIRNGVLRQAQQPPAIQTAQPSNVNGVALNEVKH
ncbi:MAG: hypothetical protein II471_06575 [Bacteroidales bacterium]|nr:hypothetical protein [Bacteroidales bacterium]